MRAPICLRCKREMKKTEIGISIEYQNANGTGEKISADQHECQECGASVASHFAERPYIRHFEKDYVRGSGDFIVQELAVV